MRHHRAPTTKRHQAREPGARPSARAAARAQRADEDRVLAEPATQAAPMPDRLGRTALLAVQRTAGNIAAGKVAAGKVAGHSIMQRDASRQRDRARDPEHRGVGGGSGPEPPVQRWKVKRGFKRLGKGLKRTGKGFGSAVAGPVLPVAAGIKALGTRRKGTPGTIKTQLYGEISGEELERDAKKIINDLKRSRKDPSVVPPASSLEKLLLDLQRYKPELVGRLFGAMKYHTALSDAAVQAISDRARATLEKEQEQAKQEAEQKRRDADPLERIAQSIALMVGQQAGQAQQPAPPPAPQQGGQAQQQPPPLPARPGQQGQAQQPAPDPQFVAALKQMKPGVLERLYLRIRFGK